MSTRPSIRRTYGKPKLASSSSSSSVLFDSSPAPFSSSPPPTELDTPGPSSPILRAHDVKEHWVPSSPPLFPSREPSPEVEQDEAKPSRVVAKAITVQSSLRNFFASPRPKVLGERATIPPYPPTARAKGAKESAQKQVKTSLTQLHLTHLPLLHTCKECAMSYVRGGDDEGLHAKHHIKVVRGMIWDGLGKGKGKSREGAGWRVVKDRVEFGRGGEQGIGRIVMCDGSWGGVKLDEILSTVDTVLSSPPLPPAILDHCKVFLFLTSSPPPSAKRQRPLPKARPVERIVSITVSQPIKTAMRVLRPGERGKVEQGEQGEQVVDSGGGVVCHPEQLPTPLGIHRLFTIPSYRGLSFANTLLDAACQYTVYGCTFDPQRGEVAFSQPTESGRRAMYRLGGENMRVFIDDERQI